MLEVDGESVLAVLRVVVVDALEVAVERVEESRALVGVAQSPFYPQIGYDGSAGRRAVPQIQTLPHQTFNLFYGAFSLAWEIDVWGRIRRASEAARESLLEGFALEVLHDEEGAGVDVVIAEPVSWLMTTIGSPERGSI